MKELTNWWGFTKTWKRDPSLDVPELQHTCGDYSFPQQLGFRDEHNQPQTISRLLAIALGLVGMKEPRIKTTFDEWGKKKENHRPR